MSIPMLFSYKNTSVPSIYSKSMSISNITSPYSSNSTLNDSMPSSSFSMNSSLSPSAVYSPCLSSHDKVSKSSFSPTYSLCSSYKASDVPVSVKSEFKSTASEKSHGLYTSSPPLLHKKVIYEKKEFGHSCELQQKCKDNNTTTALNYTTEPDIHNSFDHHCQKSNSNKSSPSLVVSTLSLDERRKRNKAASTKYRAKKSRQHGEMRLRISLLTKENELLQRQLDHVKLENNRLQSNCDRLRGKLVAEKMLRKLLPPSEELSTTDGSQLEEEYHAFTKRESTPKVLSACKYEFKFENNTNRNAKVWRQKNGYQDFVRSEK